jgi:hypothetical protein
MADKIKKIKGKVFNDGEPDNCLTPSFRELAERELGELDTAASFMYLYNRFGKPNEDHRDDYKILYDYMLRYKNICVSIHSSGYSNTYFNLFVSSAVTGPFREALRNDFIETGYRLFEQGIIFRPYFFFNLEEVGEGHEKFCRKNEEALQKAWNEYMKAKTAEELQEYKRLLQAVKKDELPEKRTEAQHNIYKYYKHPFWDSLVNKFKTALTEEERDRFYSDTPCKFSDFPEIEKQCKEFLDDLKTASYIRDVPINIKGYESEINEIIFPGRTGRGVT